MTKDDAQAAVYAMEAIFDEYEIPDEKRLALWEHFRILASDALIRFGEFDPDVGYTDRNGHA